MRRCYFALIRTARFLWRSSVASFIILSMVVPAFAQPPAPNALPTGGQVSAGAASINTSGNKMNITQSSQNAAINWQTFNIGQNAWVNFAQPNSSSIALNRVLSVDPSSIYGTMTANGQVFLLNPAGIIFGPSGSVNVGGLVASTLSLNDSDFMKGNYNFYNAGSAGSIVNQGTLTAAGGGYIALLAPQVTNQGIISAKMGTVAMAAGDEVSLDFSGDGLINYAVNQGTVNALIDNRNLVEADGGQALMTAKAADSLSSAVVNNEGIIQAQTIENKKGVIMLMGDMQNGSVNVSGTLDASAPNGGDGGFIETSASTVNIADGARITTLAPYGKSGKWLIDPTNFTISSGSAALTTSGIGATTLHTALGSGNVSIATSATANGSDLGDIDVNAGFSWSANTLTLTAYNNININAVMNATGSAGLAMNYGWNGQTDGSAIYGTQGGINVGINPGGTFEGSVNLASGTSLSINGSGYDIISSLTELKGMSLSGDYALGSNITGGAFTPVGGNGSPFTGIFDGLGHKITNLVINQSSGYAGLFGSAAGSISNVALINVQTTSSNNYIGGLVGSNSGSISNSYATGSASGTGSTSSYVGGLAGYNTGSITNSYAATSVSGNGEVGGLVGFNDSSGSISNSYATGGVTGTGNNNNDIGGLVGYNPGSISNSYAAGSVSGNTGVGGLVGYNDSSSSISNSYATGGVSGTGSNAGGLVGYNAGSISNSYSNGSVSGSGSNVGGLVGTNNQGTTTNSYWDETVNSSLADNGLGTGETTAEMETLSTFNGWSISQSGTGTPSGNTTWIIYQGITYPLLKSSLTPLTVTAKNDVTTYNAATYSGGNGVTYSPASPDSTYLLGSVSYNGNSQGAINAGSYTISPSGLYSSQQGYDITFANGSLTINPASLTLTAATNTKTYDGTTSASAIPTVAGLLGSDTVTGLTETYNNKNAGTGKTLSVSGYTINDGDGGGDYTVTTRTNTTGVINTASLTITATGQDKVYNGTTAATVALADNRVSGDAVTDNYTAAAFSDKDVGSNMTVSVSGIHISGTDASNYTLSNTTASATANITPAPLTITAKTNTKTYDSTTSASATPTVAGLKGSDTLTGLSETYNNKDAGTGLTLSVAGYTVNDGDGGADYTVTTVNNATGVINRAPLTITATTNTKTYDSTTSASPTPTVAGLLGSDTVTGLSETYNNKNVGTGKTMSVSGYTVNDGDSGGDYTVTTRTNTTGVITAAPLTLTALTNTKTYDGTTSASTTPTVAGLQGSDIVTGLIETYGSKNAGTSLTLTIASGYTVNDGDSGRNYTVTTVNDTTGVINPAALTITALTNTKTYDSTTSASATPTVAGLQGSDTVTGLTETYDNKNAGTGKTLSVAGYTVNDGDSGGDYTVTTVNHTTGTITPAPLTITAKTNTKTYDSTTSASATPTVAGLKGSDTVTGLSETYDDKNVGTGKTLSVGSGYTVNDGDGGGDYSVTTVNNTTGVISRASLTITATTDTKTYDGATTAAAIPTVAGLQGSDTVTGLSETYNNKSAGTGKTLSVVSGYTVNDGDNGGDYTVTTRTNATGVINPASLTVTAAGQDKVYNGTTAATVTLADNRVSGDTVTDNYTSAAFSDKNTGSGKTVSVSGISISGADASDYTLVNTTASTTANITPAPLTITAKTNTKTYDSTTSAAATPTVAGLKGLDTVTGLSETYDSKDAGTGKTLNIAGYVVNDGDSGGDYTVTTVNNTTGVVRPASLTITATTNTKTYDSTTSASATPTVAGLLGSDTVTGLSETYNNKNAGTGKTLSVAGYTVNDGNSGGDYTVTTRTNTTGVITPASLTLTALTNTKTYDGTTSASATPTMAGLQGSDTVTGLSETYGSKNVGTSLTLTVASGYTVNDGDSGRDYTVTAVNNTTGVITPASLTLTALTNTKTYDGTNSASATPTVAGLQGSDTVTGLSETYNSKNAGTGKTLSVVSGYTVNDGDSGGDYTVTTVNNTTGVINPASLTVTATGQDKVYNGTTAATVTLADNKVVGDNVTDNYTSADFSDRNAGSGKTVSVSGISISGADADNYTLVNTTASTTANITPAALTLTAANNTKTYDSTTSASATPTVVGLQGSDTLTGLSESYDNKNAGTGKSLSVAGYTINDGDNGSNYTVTTVNNTTGVITPASLTLTALTNTKTYDGASSASVTPTVVGLLGSDTVTNLSETYNNKNAGTGKTLSVTGYTINDGNGGGDYAVTTVNNTTGVITPASLTLTALTNTKTYDGTASASATPTVIGLQGSDTVTGLSETYNNKNAGTGKTLSVTGYTVNDGDSGGDYTVNTVNNTTGVITPASLTLTATTNTKIYDGTTSASASPTVSGLMGGDMVTGLSESYTDPIVGIGKTLSVNNGYMVDDGNNGNNYIVSALNNTTGIITSVTTSANSGSLGVIITSVTSTIQTTQQPATTTLNPNATSSLSAATSGLRQTSFGGGLITVSNTPSTPSPVATVVASTLTAAPVGFTVGGVNVGSMTITDQGGTVTVTAVPSSSQPATASAASNTGGTSTGALTIYTATDEGTKSDGNFAFNAESGSVSLTQATGAAAVTVAAPVTVSGGVKSATFSVTTGDGSVLEYSVSQSGNGLSIQPANDAAGKATAKMDKKVIAALGMLAAEDKLGTSGAQINSVVINEKK